MQDLHLRALEFCRNGQWLKAVPLLRKLVDCEPDNGALQNNLGLALWQSGNADGAESAFRKAVELEPANSVFWLHYGEVLCMRGDWQRGAEALERRIRSASRDYRVLYQPKLALALAHAGRFLESERLWRRVVKNEPGNLPARNNLAMIQLRLGRNESAVRTLDRLSGMNSCNSHFHSNLLFTLLSSPSASPKYVYGRHREWARRYTNKAIAPPLDPRTRSAGRDRIRIGYVSADFRDHSVRFFMEPLLRHHDRSRFDVHVFSNQATDDDATDKLRAHSSWHNIHRLDDNGAARMIRKSGIDILIDLSGHTGGNRLEVFARKPAPVQATYLGYPATTGLPAMDFRLTDSFADPPGKTERWHSEALLRVDPCFLAYSPPHEAPVPARRKRSRIAFGSFAMLQKISPRMMRLWSRILSRVPGSVLVLKSRVFDDPESAAATMKRLARFGLTPDRLLPFGFEASREGHLAKYSEIDIALDTYPYNGTTNTCEALWMGVPCVTLCGAAHVSRVSGSILSQMGKTGWIAQTEKEYAQKAIAIAESGEFRTADRRSLRERMAASPILDHPRHAAAFEAALDQIRVK